MVRVRPVFPWHASIATAMPLRATTVKNDRRWERKLSQVLVLSLAMVARVSAAAEPGAPYAILSVAASSDAKDCPDETVLAAATERVAGHRVFGASTKESLATFDVEFSKTRDGYAAVIHVRGKGTRNVSDSGPTCAPLVEAVAVTLSILADEQKRTAEKEPAPPAAPNEPGPVAALPERRRVAIDLGMFATAGIVRPWAPSFVLDASLEVSRPWSFGLGGMFVPTQDLTLAPGSVQVSLLAARAEFCALPFGQRASVRIGACVISAAGILRAEGHGYAAQRSVARPWIAGGAGLLARGPIVGIFGWSARVDALLPFTQEAFSVDAVGIAYSPPAVGLVTGASISATIE